MKIEKNVLVRVNKKDIIDGVFENHEVTEIGEDCFNDLPNLKKVILPKVVKIGNGCFYELENLKKVILPKVVEIGNFCFRYNPSLTSIDLPLLQTAGIFCFSDNTSLRNLDLPLLKSAREYCFIYNDSLTNLDLPLLKSAGSSCFKNNDSLTSINLPLLQTAGDYCFRYNDSLTSLNLPLLKTSGNYCFRNNKSLKSINISGQKLNYLSVDGFPFIIQSEKKVNDYTVYSGYNLKSIENSIIKKEECFVAKKDNYFAHGSSIKKAISDLEFKIISEKLEKEPIQKDTLFTVNYYRTLTGACDHGIRSWMESNNIPFEVIINEDTDKEETKELTPIKAIDLMPLLEQTKPYGYEKFKSLVTW